MSRHIKFQVLVLMLASGGCGHPASVPLAPTAACLTDERGELWVRQVRHMEKIRADFSEPYLIRDPLECRRARGLFYHVLGGGPGSTPVYAIRLGNGGYVIILPGQLTGEWQDSYWLAKDGKLGPVIVGL